MASFGRSQRHQIGVVVSVALGVVLSVAVHPQAAAADPAIDAAIGKGAGWLKTRQLADGSWNREGHSLGETALAGLALLAAGERRDSPAITRAADFLRDHVGGENATYDISLAILFLDQLGEKRDVEVIRGLGLRLVRGQCRDGSWTYSLIGSSPRGDNSNAQFAVLACWVCRRHGVRVDPALSSADRYFRQTVNQANGGWGYTPSGRSTPSMTCAGLIALAARRGAAISLARRPPQAHDGQQGEPDGPPRGVDPAVKDPAVARALGYLGALMRAEQISQNSKPGTGLYFYWSLERVGVIYGIEGIGGIDWYAWGSTRLLRMQHGDGSWENQDAVDTAFAILFLAKANVAMDLTEALGGWQSGKGGGRPSSSKSFLRVERSPRRRPVDGGDEHPAADGKAEAE